MCLGKNTRDIILMILKFIPKYSMAGEVKDLLVYLAKHGCYFEKTSVWPDHTK